MREQGKLPTTQKEALTLLNEGPYLKKVEELQKDWTPEEVATYQRLAAAYRAVSTRNDEVYVSPDELAEQLNSDIDAQASRGVRGLSHSMRRPFVCL